MLRSPGLIGPVSPPVKNCIHPEKKELASAKRASGDPVPASNLRLQGAKEPGSRGSDGTPSRCPPIQEEQPWASRVCRNVLPSKRAPNTTASESHPPPPHQWPPFPLLLGPNVAKGKSRACCQRQSLVTAPCHTDLRDLANYSTCRYNRSLQDTHINM